MIRGFCYFMLFLAVLWLLQGFGAFLVDMWPLIKWGILVAAAFVVFSALGGKKKTNTNETNGDA